MRRAISGETAVITGASSGIGRQIALILDGMGYETVLVARRESRLEELKQRMKNLSRIFCADVSRESECQRLFEEVKGDNVQILVNCAGFGAAGYFEEVPLEKELAMIDTNVKAVHILTKLFLQKFIDNDSGYILNVASSAGLMPGGPLMATYYATKAYVVSLTNAIAAELEDMCSNVYIGALCPGPVDTEFNEVAQVNFAMKGISPKFCAQYAVMEMFNRKVIIIPETKMKAAALAQRLVPKSVTLGVAARYQSKKLENNEN